VREEIGDTLFTVVNIARFQGIDPEDALRLCCENSYEGSLYRKKTNLETASLEIMDGLWNEAKNIEKGGPDPPFLIRLYHICGLRALRTLNDFKLYPSPVFSVLKPFCLIAEK